jgi:DNA anti-recombination protein RmuC
MLDEEKNIDVGEANEEATTIDLDAPAAEPVKEEEIQVEEVAAEAPEAEAKTEKEELGEYSDGVQKRIAKLTRKMREAERQKEEAIQYAKTVSEDANKLKTRFNNLDNNFAKEFEQRVTGSTEAAKQRLAAAIAAGDVEAQV